MKITKTQLRQIIREELLKESKAKVNFTFKGKNKAPKLYNDLKVAMKGIDSNEFGEFFTSVSAGGRFQENYIKSLDKTVYDVEIQVLFENKLNQKLQFNYINRKSTDENLLYVTMNNKVLSDSNWGVRLEASGFFKLMFDLLKRRF